VIINGQVRVAQSNKLRRSHSVLTRLRILCRTETQTQSQPEYSLVTAGVPSYIMGVLVCQVLKLFCDNSTE